MAATTRAPQEVLERHAEVLIARADGGIDTFVFADGQIRAQTVRYTLQRS
jgi:hypothetical protein